MPSSNSTSTSMLFVWYWGIEPCHVCFIGVPLFTLTSSSIDVIVSVPALFTDTDTDINKVEAKYYGYKLDAENTIVADSVTTGAVIRVYYVTDDGNTKNLSYTAIEGGRRYTLTISGFKALNLSGTVYTTINAGAVADTSANTIDKLEFEGVFVDNKADAEQADIVAAAKADEKIASLLEGKTIIKEIYVKGKLVNIVAK